MGSEILLGVVGGGGAVILFAAGYLSVAGTGMSTLTIGSPPGAGANCSTLCGFWNSARSVACTSAAAAAAAAAALATAKTMLASAAVVAGCTEPALTQCLTTPSPCPAVP